MKFVLLSADSVVSVYLVPDEVGDDLSSYCVDFCDRWMHMSPNAQKYHTNQCVCYNEKDFIEYLNKWVFPDMPSKFIETIGWINLKRDIPRKYKECQWFNF